MMYKAALGLLTIGGWLLMANSVSAQGLWPIQSIDTMKYARDASRDSSVVKLIPAQVKAVAETGANYIALGTPYDEEFVPRLKLWVAEARKHQLKVWFRGNLSGWEGWFDYPKFSDPNQHHLLLREFITSHPELFAEGDIFTPMPEPENGVLGDPRSTGRVEEFNNFLIASYDNCVKAFAQIKVAVKCGYFSTNGDIARYVLTPEVVKRIGGQVVVDHYVRTPDQLVQDVIWYEQKFNAPVILGEYGAPIPDLHGEMSEQQQADYISQLLNGLYQQRNKVGGMNYWVLSGGSTALLNEGGQPRKVVQAIRDYYLPITVTGSVRNTIGQTLSEVKVMTSDNVWQLTNNAQGKFSFSVPVKPVQVSVSKAGYKPQTIAVIATHGAIFRADFILEPEQPNAWYKLMLRWRELEERLQGRPAKLPKGITEKLF